MTALSLDPRWLPGDLDDPEDAATFAEIAVSIDGDLVSQLEDPATGRASTGPHIPTLPLALGLAERWWRLLYEPEKQRSDRRAEARHRLDVLTPGYVFPPVALWSGGEGIVARVLTPDTRFQRHRFILPERDEPWYLPRVPVEKCLVDFIESTVSRVSAGADAGLREAWNRVRLSMADADEAAWCAAAGRLGFDPYDPDTPDLQALAGSLSPVLFAELSEAATVEELPPARDWIETQQQIIADAPAIDIEALGKFPHADADDHPAHLGQIAAERVQFVLGRCNPRDVFRDIIGGDACMAVAGPRVVQGLAHRVNGGMRAIVQAQNDAQRRFRLCHAVFVAWEAGFGEDRLVSPARTRRHQAGRAFAAEVLAPTSLLRERTAGQRPTMPDVELWAQEFGTTAHVVKDQLWNRLRLTPRSA
jgi:hypothetical protein